MFALLLTLLAARPGETCKESCTRWVTEPRARANVCGRCFTDADRAAWAVALAELTQVPDTQLEKILADPDWAVRWGALRALAKRKAVTDVRMLADWVAARPDDACATAVHVAGAKKQTPAALLPPAGAALCWERRDALTKQLEVDMYSEAQTTRLEALTHLASFLERPHTRVVLDAMKSRAPQTDELSAGLLVEASRLGSTPAGKALLDAGRAKGDEELVNRLLQVWSKRIDAQRPLLTADDKRRRREAINALAELAPLSAPELEGALDDPDPANRRAAAKGLAAGEGASLATFARKKLDPGAQVPLPARIKWVAAVGTSGDPACSDTLRAALGDERHDDAVRSAALAALADCAGPKALDAISQAQTSPKPSLRAGAALALGSLPRQAEVPRRLEAALKDPDPLVLAAAAHTAGVLRQRSVTQRLVELVDHADADVRREAVVALAAMETPGAVPRLIRSLSEDGSAPVREAAARALGDVGGSTAVPALISASQHDQDEKVKFVAAESLRKLGFTRSSGSMSP